MENMVRKIRRNKDITQMELANMAGISQPYLVDVEKGRRGAKEDTKKRIADALGVTVADLWGGDEGASADPETSG